MKNLRTRCPIVAVSILLGIVVAMVVWLRPWMGLMDDAHYTYLMCMQPAGFASAFSDFIRDDLRWGMFRPTFPLMVYGLYCTTRVDPVLLFLLNTALVGLVLIWLAHALSRLGSLNGPVGTSFAPIYVITVFSFFRFHDIFLHPSLQEKLIFAVGAAGLWLFSEGRWITARPVRFYWVSALVLLIGLSTKAQFVIFIPALTLLLSLRVLRRDASCFQLIYFIMLSAAGVIGVQMVAKLGSYTSGYSWSKAAQNLGSREGLFLIAVSFLSIAWEFLIATSRGLERVVVALLPSSFVMAFLAVFAPWQIRDGYLMVGVIPFAAFCLLLLLWRIPMNRSLSRAVATVIFIVAAAVTTYRSYRNYGRLGDIRRILFSDELRSLEASWVNLVVPCEEGAKAMAFYIQEMRRLKIPVVQESNQATSSKLAYFGDSALCPFVPGPDLVRLTKPRFEGSFILYGQR